VHQNASYDHAALRDGEPYLVIVYYGDGVTHVIPRATLTEAMYLARSKASIVELAKVEEVAEGVPVRKPLAIVVDGVWIIAGNQKELSMAKVKESLNGGGRDVAGDLLGVTKPRGKKQMELVAAKTAKVAPKKVAAAAAPKERTPKASYADTQRLKKIGDRNTRPDSNVGKAISLLKPNMTFGEFRKAMEKTKNPLPPAGILSFLVKESVVQVR
jgi:hypothetical protein